jgi:hypothetical protein
MFGGAASITLSSGAVVRCGGDGVSIVLERPFDGDGEQHIEELQLERPYPSAGVGGLELVVSPDERIAALFVYSGQSQQGWELFALDPIAADPRKALRWVSSLPYVKGEGMAPVFSPDGRWLVMAVTADWCARMSGEHAEDALDGGEGSIVIDWIQLYAQQIPDTTSEEPGWIPGTRVVTIGTRVQRTMDPEELLAWTLDQVPRFGAGDRVAIALPWGEEIEVSLPPSVAPLETPEP